MHLKLVTGIVVTLLVVGCALFGSDDTLTGTWADANAVLHADKQVVNLHDACNSLIFDGPLIADSTGRFERTAQGINGDVSSARISGQVSGSVVTLDVTYLMKITRDGSLGGHHALQHNAQPDWAKPPIAGNVGCNK